MKSFQISGLIACLLATSASAIPVTIQNTPSLSTREEAPKKCGLLWDWKNTNALETGNGGTLQATANSFENSKISWVMNWETWRPTELPTSIPFQPVVATKSHLSGDGWKKLQDRLAEGCTTVHFFNEPERNGIAAGDAVNDWKTKMLPLREANPGLKLVGPAVASSPEGSQWFNAFYGALSPQEYPDFVGLHFYTLQDTPAAQEVVNAKAYFEEKHNSFQLGNVPVVVSEIGSTSRDPASVSAFTTEMVKYFEGESYIAQYAFFGASREPTDGFVSPAAQLLDSAGSLTQLGKTVTGAY